ncbi:MAG: tetratricopeptide repeat protein [Verrucomicrobia bacterium]|nr:tetratricopeptide repeat protein [Verrucomicrobiota bacterium]
MSDNHSPLSAGRTSTGSPQRTSSVRKWLFRLIVAVVFPLVLLLVGESVLRIVDYGYPTTFLIPSEIEGRQVLVDNQKFGWRFFPQKVSRNSDTIVLPVEKDPEEIRIFVLGGSAAQGDPDPDFGVSRVLQLLLEAAYPDRPVRVINAAITAINSHVVREIAHDCLLCNPDVLIVYMGNNEVLGPYGPGSIFGDFVPGTAYVRASAAVKKTKIGQGLSHLVFGSRDAKMSHWRGLEMFSEKQVRHDDARLEKVYTSFRRNLESIAAQAKDRNVLFCTVATDLAGTPPFMSAHAHGISAEDLKLWESEFEQGKDREADEDWPAALDHYRKAEEIDGEYAELYYRSGRCLERQGQYSEARQQYVRARDLDSLRFRADSRINEIIRHVAGGRGNNHLVMADVEQALSDASAHGLPGSDLFYEHVHFNFAGTYAAAVAMYSAMLKNGFVPELGREPELPSLEECERRLAFTPLDQNRVLGQVFKRLVNPPFSNQAYHDEKLEEIRRAGGQLGSFDRLDRLPESLEIYDYALRINPDDWVIRENHAELLRLAGRYAEAEKEYRRVLKVVPHRQETRLNTALATVAQGRVDHAMQTLESKALQIPYERSAAFTQMGIELLKTGQTYMAAQLLVKALHHDPASVEAHHNLGMAYMSAGNSEKAIEHFERALYFDPGHVRAMNNLGVIKASQGLFDEAIAQYKDVLALSPDMVETRHNMGNALYAAGRTEEAIEAFDEVIRLRPGMLEAYKSLGALLSDEKDYARAADVFRRGIKESGDDADLHNGLGGALIFLRDYEGASLHLNEALRLMPKHPGARNNLAVLEAHIAASQSASSTNAADAGSSK